MKELWADPDGPFRRSLLPGGAMQLANEKRLEDGWADDGVYRKSLEDGPMRKHLDEGWADDGAMRLTWAPGGAAQLASEAGWAEGGVYDVMIQKLWAPGGACRRMVEDRDSAFWTGMARGIARRRAATEARWAEQRKAHAASGRDGNFAHHGTDFAGVRGNNCGFQMKISVGGGKELRMTYRDEYVAALAYDFARGACGREALNYPTRAVCLAVPPPPDVLEEMMRQAVGGGSCVRVVLRETIDQYRARWVVSQTLARELSKIRSTEVRRELVKLRERGGVLDVVCDAIAARVDALDLERMLGDRLRAEGFAAPPGDGRVANGKKRGRASSDDDDAAKLERLREELEQLRRDNDRLKRIKKAEELQLPQYPAASPRKKRKVIEPDA